MNNILNISNNYSAITLKSELYDDFKLYEVLPKFMMDYVKEKTKSLGYRSIAEYIRELVRVDMIKK